jgi:predicted RNA binding protein YcfA (HicA-like mRNA interferase family)
MPSLERDDIESSLLKKGFTAEEGDHRFFKLVAAGKYTGIYTKTSRGKKYKTLSSELVSKMASQLELTTKEFVSLVDCSLSGEEYLRLLEERDKL